MKGGKVIASGTYGCILNPALPCKNEVARPPHTVSKLMSGHDASIEMDEINKISVLTKTIPNHNRFYILNNIKICNPSPLKQEDLLQFDEKCYAMKKRKITASNVNNPRILDNLRILQLPNGGLDITHYFSDTHITPTIFIKINNSLIKLFAGGIIPLRTINVLHKDIKGSNIVYNERENISRLIDWGLSITTYGNHVHTSLNGWPIMYNQPFGIILFTPSIQSFYKAIITHKGIQSYKGSDIKHYLHLIVTNAFKKVFFKNTAATIKYIGSLGNIDHLRYVMGLIFNLINPNLKWNRATEITATTDTVTNIICDHLASILIQFSVNADNTVTEFRELEYYDKVYKHNCDIYGFISTYYDIILNTHIHPSIRMKVYDTLIYKYLLSNTYTIKPFPVHDIMRDCYSLNQVFLSAHKQVSSPIPKQVSAPMPKSIHIPKAIPIPKAVPIPMPKSIHIPKPNKPKPILIQQQRRSPVDIFTWSLQKRCPKGTQRNKKSGKCVKVTKKKQTQPKVKQTNKLYKVKLKRCPNGTRRNKKTGKCE
jgi:serine/threonine protein kinase